MSTLYARLEATARRLIAAYGKSATIVRITNGGPPHAPVPSEATHAALIVETGHKMTLIPETLIEAGDRMGIISTDLGVAPRHADKIEIDGTRYNFVDLKPLNPGGTILLYEFLARA